MAWLTGIDHGWLPHGGRHLIFLILASSALIGTAHTSPLPDSSYDIAISNTTLNSPLLQTSWTFDCYAGSIACRGTGTTSAGSHAKQGCSPIGAQGCTRYSYNGGGLFKLCLYGGTGCSGALRTSVNGGKVTCIDVGDPKSFKVVPYAAAC
ncbi:uncharacterized protein N7500_006166 [Penicillium coprophilum]|uniref:uncharacterized protein n=1 Tax=Penicillium coprophilum TaxID=36646 RepID=UPI00239186D0|nr:uncharacterized protein N7500_006166 [Penicillium coprophilum]KAJ5164336.1 hypothetical protein N7500_006166 [Penicillium coprophilum]